MGFNSTIVFYSNWITQLAAAYSYTGHVFKCILCDSGYTPSLLHDTISDITNELSGNGYSRQVIPNIKMEYVGGAVNLDADNTYFTAAGGSIVGRYFIVWDETADLLVAYGLLNNTGANVTIADTFSLRLNFGAIGIATETVYNIGGVDEEFVVAMAISL